MENNHSGIPEVVTGLSVLPLFEEDPLLLKPASLGGFSSLSIDSELSETAPLPLTMFEPTTDLVLASVLPLVAEANLASDAAIQNGPTQNGLDTLTGQQWRTNLTENSLTFKGSALADTLFLRASDENLLAFSTDGVQFEQVDTLDFDSISQIKIDLLGGDDQLFIDRSLSQQLTADGSLLYLGGTGQDVLFGPGTDATWNILGQDAGNLDGAITFEGVENLSGDINNQDTFVFGAQGRLSGLIDGGAGGFDTLVVNGESYTTISSQATGPDSGNIFLGDNALGDHVIAYAGLEPVLINAGSAKDVVFDVTAVADEFALETDAGGGLTLRSINGTFETTVISAPIDSLQINAGLGDDSLTIGSLDLGAATLSVEGEAGSDTVTIAAGAALTVGALSLNAETIAVGAGAIINSANEVELLAIATQQTALPQASQLVTAAALANLNLAANSQINAGNVLLQAQVQSDLVIDNGTGVDSQASAAISLAGQITSQGNITVQSEVDHTVNLKTDEITLDLLTTFASVSTVDIAAAAALSAQSGVVQLSAMTTGIAASTTQQGRAQNTATETATVRIGETAGNRAVIDAQGIDLSAKTETEYTAIGAQAVNQVSGETRTEVVNAELKATAAGISLAALDKSRLTSTATRREVDLNALAALQIPNLVLEASKAQNELIREVAASIVDAQVRVENGDLNLLAEKSAQMSATAAATSVSARPALIPTFSLSGGGTFATNSLLGSINAFIADSNLETTGAGAVSVAAQDASLINADAQAGQLATGGTGSAAGGSLSFNALGWEIENFFTRSLDTLLGTTLGDIERPSAVNAYLSNSTVNAAGALSLSAASDAQLNATVSNVAKDTASALYGANGIGVSGILSGNKVSRSASAYIDNELAVAGSAIAVGGKLTITADNNTAVFSNSKIVTSQITTNTGGVDLLNDQLATSGSLVGPPTYNTAGLDTTNSTQTLNFGDTVSLSLGFDRELGKPGRTYTYLGESGYTVDLLKEDYANLDLWKEQLATQLQNDGLNLSASNSVALGGMVVRNEVRGGATAYVKAAKISAAAVEIDATDSAVIEAIADATAESSGGSAFGSGQSIAANGTIAVNTVLGDAIAYIEDSEIVSAGTIAVDAKNTSRIEAETKSAINTGADAFGLILAFNTLGYEAQNLLFGTFDALLGFASNNSVFGNENPAKVSAYIRSSEVSAAGDLTVTADALAEIGARTSNSSTAAGAALFGASAMITSGVLASNKVSSAATAFIDNGDNATNTAEVKVAGELLVTALDESGIDAVTNMTAAASKKNDLGLGIVNDLFNTLTGDYQYTTNSGRQALQFGDQVRLDDVDYTTDDPPTSIAQGDWVELASDVGNGFQDEIYEYVGTGNINGTGLLGKIDFDQDVDFSDATNWRLIEGKAGTVYQYMGDGVAGGVNDNRDLATEDYTNFALWKELSENNVIPSSISAAILKDNKLDTGTAQSFYGVVARNDVEANVLAYLDQVALSAPANPNNGPTNIIVTATDAIELTATDTSVISSSSESKGGVLTNNQLRGHSDAYITHSRLQQSGRSGEISVTANNISKLDATSLTESKGAESVGAVVSFNSIGWEASNVIFQAVDALLGVETLTNEDPARAHAYIEDSVVIADGDVRVLANASALLNATTGNEQASTPTNSFLINSAYGKKAMAAGGMLASNKTSSEAQAWIDYSDGYAGPRTITAGGTVEVKAEDEAGIVADSQLAVEAIATNNLDALIDVAIALSADDYNFTTASGTQVLSRGNRVRLANNYRPGQNFGDGGAVYEYIGAATSGPGIDLSNENFNNQARWRKITLGVEDLGLNIGNLSASPARAYGGLVVLNDVRSDVDARLANSLVNADEVSVVALENASIQAFAESSIEASGGSAFKELGEGAVFAANGLIATNIVQAQADALLADSTVTTTQTGTTGDVSVSAMNTSGVDATINAAMVSGEKAFGAVVALNTLGWEASNVLLGALEAIIGDPVAADALGLNVGAKATAKILDSVLQAAGGVAALADNAARLNATVSNAASSAASALFDAGGQAAGGVIASNKVSSGAQALIEQGDSAANNQLTAGGDVAVAAADNAELNANVKLVSSSITTNDGGASVLNEQLSDVLSVDFVSTEGVRDLVFGDRVRLADDHVAGGDAGSVYEYMGAGQQPGDTRDLTLEDFSNTDFWKAVLETQLIPQNNNLTPSDSQAIGGVVVLSELDSQVEAAIKQMTVSAAGDVSVRATENAAMKAIADATVTSSGGSVFGEGESQAYNGIIATNVVLTKTDAFIENSQVTTTAGGDVIVEAFNRSEADAQTKAATTSGADAVGVLLAFNTLGYDSRNLLFNTLDGLFGLSELTPELEGLLVDYDLNDGSQNYSSVDVQAGDWVKLATGEVYEAIGSRQSVDLAVEDYGSERTNWIEVKSPFGNEIPARAQAYIRDTDVTAAGDILVTAESAPQLNAVVNNDATAKAAAFFGASALSGSGVLASNKVSGLANAFIEFTQTQGTIDAAGSVSVRADDASGLDAFTALGNTATKTNDLGAGLLNDLVNDLKAEYQYTTKSGTPDLAFGDKVLVASDYVLPGNAVDSTQETVGQLFIFMGANQNSVDLANEDYSNYERWKAVNDDNLVPSKVAEAAVKGFDKSTGSGKSFYGTVIRNDLQAQATSYIHNADVDAGNNIEVDASETAAMTALDQSVIKASSEATGGLITTNQLQSQTVANVTDSDLATGQGDIVVDAENAASLDASSLTASKASESVGVVVAINTVGWDASNILFQGLDALLGDTLLTGLVEKQQDGAQAYILNSTVRAADDLSVTADDSAKLNATVGNEQVSGATNSFLVDAKNGKNGMSASGTLASNRVKSEAKAHIDNSDLPTGVIQAGGALTVEARDEARIDANTKVVTESVTTNTLSDVVTLLGNLLPDDYAYTTASGSVSLSQDDRVRVGPSYTGPSGENFGDAGSVYKYVGSTGASGTSLNLGTEDYTNTSRWKKITGGADDINDAYPNFGNLSASDARAYGVLVVINDVRSQVESYIKGATVSAGEVVVRSLENAAIQAEADSNVTASGGSAFKELGEGTVIAVNGNIVTNLVQSQSEAYIVDSDVTTNNAGTTGDLLVDAKNTSGIDATLLSTTDSGDEGIGLTLAFNTLGWQSQNVLFNTIEALLGDPIISGALGGENPAKARAYIQNSALEIAGALSATADNDAQLNATTSNATESAGSALADASSKAFGGLVAMNKVSSGAEAFIERENLDPQLPALQVGGALTIKAEENAGIYANTKIVASSVTTNDGGVGVVAETVNDLVSADFNTDEGTRDIEFGDRVRLSDAYDSTLGNPGSVYQFMGATANGAGLDLGVQDYTDLGLWKEVLETQLFPDGVNIDNSDSTTVGGLVVLNDLRSNVEARLQNVVATAGSIDIDAIENATVTAIADSTAISSGGNSFDGQGESLAANGVIATNGVLSAAQAFINNSDVTTTLGDVAVDAKNLSSIDAQTLSATQTGANGVGVTLAFNQVGWDSQNWLFNAVDTILGDPLIANAFGNQTPALVQAYIRDSSVDAAGGIDLSAVSEARVNAVVTNETESAAYSFGSG